MDANERLELQRRERRRAIALDVCFWGGAALVVAGVALQFGRGAALLVAGGILLALAVSAATLDIRADREHDRTRRPG